MWRIWWVLRLTPVFFLKKKCILFIVCINCLFICSMLKYHFVLNEIVEIALVGLMPMEEDPSTVVLDNDE